MINVVHNKAAGEFYKRILTQNSWIDQSSLSKEHHWESGRVRKYDLEGSGQKSGRMFANTIVKSNGLGCTHVMRGVNTQSR